MGNLCRIAATLVVGGASVAGQQTPEGCPTLEVPGPAGLVNPMQRVTVVARIGGDVGVGSVSSEWKLSHGRVVAGQGTPVITFYAGEGDQGKNVEVTVAARGVPDICDIKTVGSISVASIPEFDSMDEHGKVGPRKTDLWDFLSRLDTFIWQIQSNPGSEGFLVIDFNSKDTTDHKTRHLKRIFDHFALRRFDLARLTIGLSEANYPEKTTFMGTWPPKALVPKYVRGYKIINAEDYRSNLHSLFPLGASATRTFREAPETGPDMFWLELPSDEERMNKELNDFF